MQVIRSFSYNYDLNYKLQIKRAKIQKSCEYQDGSDYFFEKSELEILRLKIKADGEMQHPSLVLDFVILHAPRIVKAQEVAEKLRPESEAETADKRLHLPFHHRGDVAGSYPSCIETVVFRIGGESRPCRAHIAEGYQLQ